MQFIQSAQEFLLPKLRQKYYLWFCCDGGIFHKSNDDNESDNKSLASLYEDLNIQELDEGDPRINQVRTRKKLQRQPLLVDEDYSQQTNFLFPSQPQLKNVRESAKDVYETYDDYLELYIQFGRGLFVLSK